MPFNRINWSRDVLIEFQSDLDRDSGTESDDEQLIDKMESVEGKENSGGRSRAPVSASSGRQRGLRERDPSASTPSTEEEDHQWADQHSSEEELECFNGRPEEEEHVVKPAVVTSALRFGPSAFGPPTDKLLPRLTLLQQGREKRKWAQVNGVTVSPATASSDDEVQALIGYWPLPVQFRTSPPEGAHRPMRSQSPPPKLFVTDAEPPQHVAGVTSAAGGGASGGGGGASVVNGNASPRKRHRHAHRPHNIQRPCLDFEKMQQMKNRSVSTWRHDGELSLFCW